MKAVRGAELSLDTLNLPKLAELSDEEIDTKLYNCDDERLFVVYEAIKRGIPCGHIHDITKIDLWFLYKLQNLVSLQKRLETEPLTKELYRMAKKFGFLDSSIQRISGQELPMRMKAAFKMVDTCGAEFDAQTPYFYGTFDEEDEAGEFIRSKHSDRKDGDRFRLRTDPHRPGH